MKKLLASIVGGRLQRVLIASFALVAAVTIGLNTLVISQLITQYLSRAEAEVVARDMELAKAFYQLKLDEIAAISHRLALDPWVIQKFPAASRGDSAAVQVIDQQIMNKITVLALGGTHLIAVLDGRGELVVGRLLNSEGGLSSLSTRSGWGEFPIVRDSLAGGAPLSATEVIPKEYLAQVGLEAQAHIALVETPRATPELFDPREGTAGLALTGVHPLRAADGRILGAVLSVYLFNNDFTLVDRIKEVARIDTVTIFFGDLRVSTNVRAEDGRRAVGTRISETVRNVVLAQSRDYVGRAYVVNEWFITRYAPLLNARKEVVGSLYVGARESSFLQLVHSFNKRVTLIALFSVLLAGVIAVPFARFIIKPITELVRANRRLAEGDMTTRVKPSGGGELAVLGHSFNQMIETLRRAQQELVHKEKLASMGQLAAGVAHEINNPLGSILLFADMLRQEAPADDPRRKDLQMIVDETLRCKKIVSDLLNFARQQEFLAQDADLHEIIEQAIHSVERLPGFSRVRIVRDFSERGILIQADPAQLIQVFVNLLNNAADAMAAGGSLTVRTRVKPAGTAEVAVSDTGCGIPEENLAKLFTPFFTTKPVGKGTGLGLSIVYGIIKMHRGQIDVASKPGVGTTFTVTLPLPGAAGQDSSKTEGNISASPRVEENGNEKNGSGR
ncbi:MAG TPA: cache domain-containing protein [Thermodesulfobacteriota bacterium]|nr:cache domain-containing protein [Thermodesulfobacteriota bacterium]